MNDSRLTAYALGELDGPERETFERELAASPELQRAMKETHKLVDALATLPAGEETLTDSARAELLNRCAKNLRATRRQKTVRRAVIIGGLTAAAACLVISLSVPAVTGALTRGKFVQEIADRRQAEIKEMELALNEMPAAGVPASSSAAREGAKVDLDQKIAMLTADTAAPAPSKAVPSAPATEQTHAMAELAGSSAAPPVTRMPAADGSSALMVSGGWSKNNVPREPRDEELRRRPDAPFDTEAYDSIQPNAFLDTKGNPLSTFSIDVDTASYANVRRFLQDGRRPPAGAVRIEELINYFPYTLPQPAGDVPFSVTTDVTRAPWNEQHLLARIALKGRELATDALPPSNLVFLVDVSGSMQPADKLPLLKRSLRSLVEKLNPRDRVAIAVYAGSSGLALPSTSGEDKPHILAAIDQLEAGGSTNSAEGIELAYRTAREQFLEEGNNRVILCTDGDFNVGVTSQSELVEIIERERASGVFLSVLGFGTGNLKDSTMEKLADKGNGNYAYIDSPSEGRKVLVEQMGATLFTIAKDVKIQVEFNPATVAGYRLIGYENRLLAKEDFNDDKKDAGEIGAGHTVTALYEIVPAGQPLPDAPSVDPLKYQPAAPSNRKSKIENPKSQDLFTVKLRYKAPDGDTSKLIENAVATDPVAFDQAPADLRFAAAVAAFGMKLRDPADPIDLSWDAIQKIARESLGEDPGAYRAEFLTLIEKARQLPENRE